MAGLAQPPCPASPHALRLRTVFSPGAAPPRQLWDGDGTDCHRPPGRLSIRSAGRSKAKPRPKTQKPQGEPKTRKGFDRPNLGRRGRRRSLSPAALAQRLLDSPQLSPLGAHHPLLSACLCPVALSPSDEQWMEAHADEVKEALGLLSASPAANAAVADLEGGAALGEQQQKQRHPDGEGVPAVQGLVAEEPASGLSLEEPDWGALPGWEMREGRTTGSRDGLGRASGRASGDSPLEAGPRRADGAVGCQAGQDDISGHVDQLLFLAWMHRDQPGRSRAVKVAGSRLAFLGEHVVELALAQFLLLRYPKETPASLRERCFGLLEKKVLPSYLEGAGLSHLLFPEDVAGQVPRSTMGIPAAKSVFYALLGAGYLTRGMPEVYRLLFEVFGLDPERPSVQPKLQRQRDDDRLAPEVVEFWDHTRGPHAMSWEALSVPESPAGSLFAQPLLFHACVPPGILRFRGCDWLRESLGGVLQRLAWPRPAPADPVPLKQGRNEAMVFALMLCFMHPTLFKDDHPRFCYERLEYLGQKTQGMVLAERLLLEHLDAPILWLQDRHSQALRNRACSKLLRDKGLDKHIWMSPEGRRLYQSNDKFKTFSCAAAFQAIHGCAYAVYGFEEVKRLMFAVWEMEGGWVMESPISRDGNSLPALVGELGLSWDPRTPLAGFTTQE